MDVEVKVLISGEQGARVQDRIPKKVDAKKREVWFFETGTLQLKQQEVVLRARVSPKKKAADVTAKWRRWVSPFAPVQSAWEQLPGFKAELDASLTEGVPAWSITAEELPANLVQQVLGGEESVRKLFSKHQRLLAESAWPTLPWDQLQAWGPIASVQWKLHAGVTIERWTVGDESAIEVSQRGRHYDVVLKEIRAWLSANDITAETLTGGKTAWALARLVRAKTRSD